MTKEIYIKEKVNAFVPYLATFYYVEIIYLMIFTNFLYGKIFAVASGLLLTVLLTIHVIRLFNKKDINRKIQLYFMDIHFAYSLAYFFNRVISESPIGVSDSIVITIRLLTACIEIVSVLILTDKIIKGGYAK